MILYQYFWYVKYFTILIGKITYMIKVNFSENLKSLRKIKKMTQKQLAEILGVDQRTVSAWEKNICEPSFNILAKLCEIFNEDFNSLLS